MKRLRPSDALLAETRARHEAARRRRQHYLEQRAAREGRVWHPYQSAAISLLGGTEKGPSRKNRTPELIVQVPPDFSVIHNPGESIRRIVTFANGIRRFRPKGVHFDHHGMTGVDLAAESLLGLAAAEMAKEYASRGGRRPSFAGTYPVDRELRRFLKAIGIIKNLEVKHEYPTRGQMSSLRIFHRRNRGIVATPSAGAPDFKSIVLAEFVRHIDSCLRLNGRQLTTLAKQRLLHYTGEIVGNAEEHSGMAEWSIVGYLDNMRADHSCEIAIFNFGKSIAETLEELPRDSYAWREVAPYVQAHSKRQFFASDWSAENLLTLVALQGHVSSKNKSKRDNRGQGTVDLIEFFQGVHKECVQAGRGAEMAILSGQTHILFDGKYRMRANNVQGRKIIAFNADNDLNEKPDRKYIQNLSVRFPGTIISIKFPLQSSQVEERNT